ncbi:cytidine deaminase-like protein [Gymnopilus junonius]|uniref:Cytosine deaminase n=1 Tax=Gymnopilus junonius TaxID=109634 RepID=A0A9P5TLE4_GYMJU|nr:cytidine deaminase-like protein [Gymnopilus junonius]
MPTIDWRTVDDYGMQIALAEARKSFEQGGIPIGSALLILDEAEPNGYKVLGSGHNQRIQNSSPTLHGEISALENAGRLKADTYRRATIYTTLSPCSMCSGAISLYKIPRLIIGENQTFKGDEALLQSRGVDIIVVDNAECKDLMKKFISEKPQEWDEDIGELTN